MVTIGVDPHKQTHTAVAVDELGRAARTADRAGATRGIRELLGWGRTLDRERVWVIEDCPARLGSAGAVLA